MRRTQRNHEVRRRKASTSKSELSCESPGVAPTTYKSKIKERRKGAVSAAF